MNRVFYLFGALNMIQSWDDQQEKKDSQKRFDFSDYHVIFVCGEILDSLISSDLLKNINIKLSGEWNMLSCDDWWRLNISSF